MMRIFTALLLCLLLPHAAAQTRAALVVGNCLYVPSKSLDAAENLPNACKDARVMAQALRTKNFTVLHKENLNTAQMESALVDFKKMLNQGAAGVFYYAGHALQDNKLNYLLPVRTDINCDLLTSQLRKLALTAQDVLTEMEAERAAMKVLILDACRISPLQNCSRGGRGLASMEKSRGTVISYATDPGKVAYDASGYTPALVKAMNQYGHLPVTQMLRRAGEFMNKDFAQTPWVEATLAAGADFCFGECGGGYVPLPPRKPDVSALLADCAFYFNNNWLLTGSAGNDKTAVACYRQVLAQDSSNRAAFEGLRRVEQQYATWAEQALNNGNRNAARVHRDRLYSLNADSPLLAGLDERLNGGGYVPLPTGSPTSSTASPLRTGSAFVEQKSGIRFIPIPGGCFQMGSNNGDSDEKPVHRVCVDGFYMAETEVTQAQWEKVMGSNPSRFKGANRPVETVSWDDAQEFIQRLGGGYRLPTEAEWEYAARAGSSGEYSKDANGREVTEANLSAYAWYNEPYPGNGHHPVKQKQPNAFGLYDMYGNVWEWVQDWYDSNYYANSPERNPAGPNNGTARVLRGGAWNYSGLRLALGYRNYGGPGDRNNDIGFRVVVRLARTK